MFLEINHPFGGTPILGNLHIHPFFWCFKKFHYSETISFWMVKLNHHFWGWSDLGHGGGHPTFFSLPGCDPPAGQDEGGSSQKRWGKLQVVQVIRWRLERKRISWLSPFFCEKSHAPSMKETPYPCSRWCVNPLLNHGVRGIGNGYARVKIATKMWKTRMVFLRKRI